MSEALSNNAQKVQDILRARGISAQVLELPASTRTAVEAAQAVGCQVGQIVKSLVFRRKHTNRPLLILASGANRVNEKKVGEFLGEPIAKAEAEFVHQQTGFAIGGVPPLGHSQPIETLVDRDLLGYGEIWASAGTPNAVFCLTPHDLVLITGGSVVEII